MDSRVLIRLVLIFLFLALGRGQKVDNKTEPSERESRSFGLRGSRHQLNEECTTNSKLKGTCMRRIDCIRNGGNPSGFCGAFGVCCEINLECDKVSKLKRTVIRNPKPLPKRCRYHFEAINQNVCQVRIDFDIVLNPPSTITPPAQCLIDSFEVGEIRLCGTNINQHIYVPLDAAGGTSDLTIDFNIADRTTGVTSPAYWNLVVTQLECPQQIKRDDVSLVGTISRPNHLQDLRTFLHPPFQDYDLIAPVGCLQYHTAREGIIESFNFNSGQGPYMSNMLYAICFARREGDDNIVFTAQSFNLPVKTPQTMMSTDGDCHDLLGGTPITPDDYLLIPESLLAYPPDASIYGTRYCGKSLMNGELLYSPPGPFVIYFKSDERFDAANEKGFRIAYRIR